MRETERAFRVSIPWKAPDPITHLKPPASIWVGHIVDGAEARKFRLIDRISNLRKPLESSKNLFLRRTESRLIIRMNVRKAICCYLRLQRVHIRLRKILRLKVSIEPRHLAFLAQHVDPKISDLNPFAWPNDLVRSYHEWIWLKDKSHLTLIWTCLPQSSVVVAIQQVGISMNSPPADGWKGIVILTMTQKRVVRSIQPGKIFFTPLTFLTPKAARDDFRMVIRD